MSNFTKQDILDAIRRTAKKNGGIPLGQRTFEKETSINRYECSKYWANFGEAQREAGFAPNTITTAHSEEFLLESMVALTRELGRFPTRRDRLVKRNNDSKFPNPTTISNRLGNNKAAATKISDYAKIKGYNDIVDLCRVITENSNEEEDSDDSEIQALGEVYLFKSGRHYKIGRTKDTVRRGNELRIQLPERMHLIHSIKTADPSGIEAYWHGRFTTKRMRGEWFDLSSADVKEFKRWKRII